MSTIKIVKRYALALVVVMGYALALIVTLALIVDACGNSTT